MRDIKRVIIAGSRYITEYALVVRAVERSGLRPEVVLSGTCRGVDNWKRNPKYAGNQRNTTMVLEADALIAIFEGWGVRIDSGSEDVILKARTHGLEVFEYTPAMLR